MAGIIERTVDLGCIVCRLYLNCYSPAEAHHIHTKGKRRAGKTIVIGLCYRHHRGGHFEDASRHPWKREFEDRYGSEWDLYDKTLRLLDD